MKKTLQKMQLRTNNLKSIINTLGFVIAISNITVLRAQDITQKVQNDTLSVQQTTVVKDTLGVEEAVDSVLVKPEPPKPFQRMKIDGVAAVIGENVILDSDIDVAYKQLLSEGVSGDDVSICELAGSLFENKLYAHHAIQDSIEVRDAEVNSMVDQQIAYMTNEMGTIEKVL